MKISCEKDMAGKKSKDCNGYFLPMTVRGDIGRIMNLIFLLSLLLTLSGCASGYSKFYTQRIDENSFSNLETLKENQNPVIIKTNDMKREVDRHLAKNFVVIGVSSFNGGMESDENLISQAKDVKATLAIQTSRFVTTQGSSMPLITPNGIGGFNTTAMYSQQMRYDQAAIFMAKSAKKLRFGVGFEDLTPDQRKQYERNAGVLARIIYEGSPAFDANIVPGDLIIGLDGKNVRGLEDFRQLIEAIPNSADQVIFKIIRKNLERDIIVSLGK
jgi:hypothetical protein